MQHEPTISGHDLPPLRIHHYLAWMATTAVLISVTMWFDRTARNGPPIEERVIIGSLILGAVAISGALTCAGWGFYWRKRGYAFPKEPGDWLTTWIAACVAALLAVLAGIFTVFFIEEDWLSAFYFFGGFAIYATWFLVALRGAIHYSDTVAWRVFFSLLSVLPIIAGLTSLTIAACSLLACLCWAGWNDRRHNNYRNWTHWFGMAVTLSLACALIGVDRQ
jgi:hypothetical protein